MQVLISMLIGNAVVAAALAMLALVAMKLRRPAAAHVLWLLVMVKLLTPPLWRVAVPVPGESPARAAMGESPGMIVEPDTGRVIAAAAGAPVGMTVPTPAALDDDIEKPVATGMLLAASADGSLAPPAASRTAVSAASPSSSRSICVPCVLGWCWIAGSLVTAIATAMRITRFRRLMRGASVGADVGAGAGAEQAEEDLCADVAAVAARIGLTGVPELRVVDAAVSPMLWFLGGRVQLILPRRLIEEMSAVHRESVIAHELAHLKRGDHWVRIFEIIATTILWWHPLLWLARRGLREAEEQCCDAWVVALLPDARRKYADALVDALEMVAGRSIALPGGATGLGKIKHLRRRLTMILTGNAPKELTRMGKLVVAIIAVAVVPLMPVRAQVQGQQAGPAGPNAATATTSATTQPAGADDATRRAVDALLERVVQDSDQNVRNAALMAIGRFGPRAIPALLDGVKSERTAEFSRNLLAGLGLNSVDALLATLESADPQVRKEALRTLTQIVERTYTSRPEYAGIAQAAGMGGFVGGGGVYAGAAPGFAPGPEGEGGIVVMNAAAPGMPLMAGGPIADPLSQLVAPVTKAVRDENAGVRRAALELMGQLMILAVPPGRTGELMPALQTAMGDADVDVRADAIQALLYAGPAAAGATPLLAKAIGDNNDRVRGAALMSLRAIGPDARDATPAVIAALKDPQPGIRALAAEALGALQAPPAPPAPPPGVEGMEGGAIPPVGAPATGIPSAPRGTPASPPAAVAPAPASGR